MSRGRDRELERSLSEARVPDEGAAEERAWEVVRAAYAERTPVRPTYRARRLALALAGGVVALAIGLSPAGAKVSDLVEDVIGVGADDARPALRSLPAAGELLVESEQGVWVVREDGSKRLLGDYVHGTWSPRGLFAAVTVGRQLIAVEPDGDVRWTIDAPAPVRDPRWSPSGYRIAYRSSGHLYAVAGDGTGKQVVGLDVASSAAWRPLGDSKLAPSATGAGGHVLSFVKDGGEVRTVDLDTGARLPTTPADRRRIEEVPSKAGVRRAVSPGGSRIATVERVGATSRLFAGPIGGRQRVLYSARGTLAGPTWSPDGRWLLVGWPAADQWLFIRTDRPGAPVAIDKISEQFDPGGPGDGEFPRVAGWVLPRR